MNQTNLETYLQPTAFINFEHEAIRAVVEKLDLAAEAPPEKAVRLFYWVRDEIRYNPFAPMINREDYVATTVLARGFGYCTQKALLLTALARCAGIPCKLRFADIRNDLVPGELLDFMGTNLFTYHGYVAFFLHDKWIKATPAFDLKMCEKHGFIPVEFDGAADAVFHPVNQAGEKHIEYIKDLGCRADVPFEEIVAAFEEVYVKNNPRLRDMWSGLKDEE